ncbi:MAG: hypothetical protein A3K40_08410 [Syntrophobacterales bacterium RIFOXYC2_FULL_60_23]|nr:MAG: hypothetical protein A3K40_08410 [Syntrophobacterales bacterium RIFOXYC2_FULL_60_23]
MTDANHRKTTRQPRSCRYLGALLLLGAGVIAWGLLPIPAAAAAPQAAVPQTAFDFGKITEDRPLTHTFVIRNTGTAPLQIVEVDPDCACTVPKYDRSIHPGGEGGITLTIKPFSVLHRFKKETKVRLNDPDQPVLYLTMTGVAQPFIEIKPSHIVRLRDVPGDDVRGQVRFISNLLTPFKITEYRTNIPDKIELTLKPEVPDKVYVLEVRPKEQVSGAFAGVIELFTNSKERPRLIVRVFGEIYRPSAGGQ